MRVFWLMRETGDVEYPLAEGVVFSDGRVALRLLTTGYTACWDSVRAVEAAYADKSTMLWGEVS